LRSKVNTDPLIGGAGVYLYVMDLILWNQNQVSGVEGVGGGFGVVLTFSGNEAQKLCPLRMGMGDKFLRNGNVFLKMKQKKIRISVMKVMHDISPGINYHILIRFAI
jgi:hypothetical protein